MAGNAEGTRAFGLSGRRYGNLLSANEKEARCVTPHLRTGQVFGHPAETNLGPASIAENPHRYLQLKT